MMIHNMSFQGRFERGIFDFLGLPPAAYNIDGVEYYGGVGFLKAGLANANAITTVSPGYAEEIRHPGSGWGLEGLLQTRWPSVSRKSSMALIPRCGTLGPTQHWQCPMMRRAWPIGAPIRTRSRLGFGLTPGDGPLFTVISRLTWQKGMDVLAEQLDTLVSLGGRLALLGTGDAGLQASFQAAARRHPGKIGVAIGYDEKVSHLLQGGADAIVIPSRFEPCGLTQLYGLAYG